MSDKPTGVINIHGRDYEMVALRVKRFRETRPEWTVLTEILHRDENVVIMRATISNDVGRVLATGHAEEWRKSSAINKTSAIENAETSAIGRALAALGMGGTEFATANEMDTADRKDKSAPSLHHPASLANQEEFDAMPDEAKQVLRECAMEIIALTQEDNMPAVLQIVGEMCVTQEDKMALWSLLPSNVRSAIKKASAPKAA